jgi:hypothetical protein
MLDMFESFAQLDLRRFHSLVDLEMGTIHFGRYYGCTLMLRKKNAEYN